MSEKSLVTGQVISLENIAVELGGKKILKGIDVEFQPGRITAIIGPNGAGKTTLLRSIISTVPLLSGQILINQQDVTQMHLRRLAKLIAVVPQDIHIDFSFRVDEVVLMGRYPHLRPLEKERPLDREIVERAILRLDLEALRNRDVTTLSEGECQRVLMARALATEARVLFLDEPISHLDISNKLEILDLLRELADSGYTIVVVLHDLDLAVRYAEKLLILQDGKNVAEGAPEKILEQGILEKVFRVRLEWIQGESGSYLAFTRSNELPPKKDKPV